MASRFLLDTHVLLWWLFDDPRLSEGARKIIGDPESVILVSSASVWEISTKYRLGKLPQAADVVKNLPVLLSRSRMTVLEISQEQALAAGSLAGLHRDPFDRMLIAQAQGEDIPIITTDSAFQQYPVKICW
ncbi:MAG: type II toxin-antitoxin system VapC family toxin [Smithellaceae bacterium]|nr:type II toxin-antitoxin system VapC family toxin [Smithellaceae bacterium]